MAKFKPGEPARIKDCEEIEVGREYIGKECVVVEEHKGELPWPWRKYPNVSYYVIRIAGVGGDKITSEWTLEKLTGSWDEIERLTGWRPGKSKQRKPEREAA